VANEHVKLAASFVSRRNRTSELKESEDACNKALEAFLDQISGEVGGKCGPNGKRSALVYDTIAIPLPASTPAYLSSVLVVHGLTLDEKEDRWCWDSTEVVPLLKV